jgi:hypothetical protein
MSDYARTTLTFPVINRATGSIVSSIFGVIQSLQAEGSEPLFRTFAESPDQYAKQEGIDWTMPQAQWWPDLASLSANLVVHVSLVMADVRYDCRVLAFKLVKATNQDSSTFLRLSFPSDMTSELRGSKEFGGVVRIDSSLKSELLGLSVKIAKDLGARGFVYGPEGLGPQPFDIVTLGRHLAAPFQNTAPMPFFFVGIDSSLVSRDELVRIWQPNSPILKASVFNILDLLHDSDGVVDEDNDEDEDEDSDDVDGDQVS